MNTAATILVVNCNTDEAMTSAIAAIARDAARGDTRIVGIGPSWGPRSAEGYLESFATAVATIDAVLAYEHPFDAVVMAGYGEHGREGMRQAVRQPVVDITEASAYVACLVGHRFGVVTTVSSAIAGIEDSLRSAGVHDRCAGIVASDVAVSHIADEPDGHEVRAAAGRACRRRTWRGRGGARLRGIRRPRRRARKGAGAPRHRWSGQRRRTGRVAGVPRQAHQHGRALRAGGRDEAVAEESARGHSANSSPVRGTVVEPSS